MPRWSWFLRGEDQEQAVDLTAQALADTTKAGCYRREDVEGFVPEAYLIEVERCDGATVYREAVERQFTRGEAQRAERRSLNQRQGRY